MANPRLVVITGPISAGKSTIADSLGKRLRAGGAKVAVIGLDEMYLIGKQNDSADWEWDETETWSAARRACGSLAESFFASGYDASVVEGGDFGTAEAIEELLTFVRPSAEIFMFTLAVSYDEMFRRARGDPNREPIRSDRGYKKMHASFVKQLEFLRERSECIDADDLTPDQIASHIADRIFSEER
jgi:thymidylate kinase